jgi:hypothetical protein
MDPGLSTATGFRLDRQRQAGSCERGSDSRGLAATVRQALAASANA